MLLTMVLWCRLIRILPFCVFFLFFFYLPCIYVCVFVSVFFVCNFVLFVFAMGRVAWNKPVMIVPHDQITVIIIIMLYPWYKMPAGKKLS